MNAQEIAKQLTVIHAALVDKTGEQPFIEPNLTVRQSGKASIRIYRGYRENGEYDLGTVSANDIQECFSKALDFIEKLPDPDTLKKRDWHDKLGKVIDEGHALNIEDDVMQPLRAGSAAMSKNLLTAE